MPSQHVHGLQCKCVHSLQASLRLQLEQMCIKALCQLICVVTRHATFNLHITQNACHAWHLTANAFFCMQQAKLSLGAMQQLSRLSSKDSLEGKGAKLGDDLASSLKSTVKYGDQLSSTHRPFRLASISLTLALVT